MSANHEEQLAEIERSVGPFTGFSNFFFKEILDWWKSWRFLIIIVVMSVILLSIVLFVLPDEVKEDPNVKQGITGARVLVLLLSPSPGLILFIFIIIFSTMGLLTTEKSSGTLAWNLTKPLGRTGLFVAKWLAATIMLWLSMLVIPMLFATITMIAYPGISPDVSKVAPIVLAAIGWIGLWVLFALTISLAFQSQAAVAGIMIAFWIVPNLLSVLLFHALGEKAAQWLVDRLATNAPFWTWFQFADHELGGRHKEEAKDVWVWAYVVWFVFLSAFSLRIFNRQEIGS